MGKKGTASPAAPGIIPAGEVQDFPGMSGSGSNDGTGRQSGTIRPSGLLFGETGSVPSFPAVSLTVLLPLFRRHSRRGLARGGRPFQVPLRVRPRQLPVARSADGRTGVRRMTPWGAGTGGVLSECQFRPRENRVSARRSGRCGKHAVLARLREGGMSAERAFLLSRCAAAGGFRRIPKADAQAFRASRFAKRNFCLLPFSSPNRGKDGFPRSPFSRFQGENPPSCGR